jgi:hypothetical protein
LVSRKKLTSWIHASRYLLYVRRPENRVRSVFFFTLPIFFSSSAGGRILEGAQDVKITASGTTGASPFRFEVRNPDTTSKFDQTQQIVDAILLRDFRS